MTEPDEMTMPWNEYHVWRVEGIDPETQEKHAIMLRELPDCATEAEASEVFLNYYDYPASHCWRERWVATPEGTLTFPAEAP